MSIREILENSKFWFLVGLIMLAGVVGLFQLHTELENREPIRIEGSFATATPLAILPLPKMTLTKVSTSSPSSKVSKKVVKKAKTVKKKPPKKVDK